MKKELSRVFKDKKLIFTILIMPGLMIFLVYTLMGGAINKQIEDSLSKMDYKIYIKNPTNEYLSIINSAQLFEIEELTEDDIDYELSVKENSKEAYIIFSEDFHLNLENGAKVDFYYNSINDSSFLLQELVISSLESYNIHLALEGKNPEQFAINELVQVDQKKLQAKAIAMLLPFLMITFLFQGAMAVGPESIAGDKERGTIATLLSTPTKREHIAIGKIFSLSIITILSSLSSFIGTIMSMGNLLDPTNQMDAGSIYSANDYFKVLLIMVSGVILIMSIVSVLSAFAKNIKEAGLISMPLMIISMVVGVTTMFNQGSTSPIYLYLIPLYNVALGLSNTFLLEITGLEIFVIIVSNITFFTIFAYILTKQFDSEKIMFSK